jgi:hypothetical protein
VVILHNYTPSAWHGNFKRGATMKRLPRPPSADSQ